MSPAIEVVPLVEIPDFDRITKLPAVPRFTGARVAAVAVVVLVVEVELELVVFEVELELVVFEVAAVLVVEVDCDVEELEAEAVVDDEWFWDTNTAPASTTTITTAAMEIKTTLFICILCLA